MVMVTETSRGTRSDSVLTDTDDDEPDSQRHKRVGTGSMVAGSLGMTMTAASALPVTCTSEGIERLAAKLAAKETELRMLQKTHDEYVKSSCEYEKELEGEVERSEHKNAALEGQVHSLEQSKATLQTTLTQTQLELAAAVKREQTLAAQVQEMKWTIQRLEQTNDELETATRVAQASIDELQHRVDTLTEENVFLLQEKEDAIAAAVEAFAVGDEDAKADQVAADENEDKQPTGTLATRSEYSVDSRTASSSERRKAPRLPEVVESCLHLTCSHEQCRQIDTASIAKAALAGATTSGPHGPHKRTRKSFLERLGLRWFARA